MFWLKESVFCKNSFRYTIIMLKKYLFPWYIDWYCALLTYLILKFQCTPWKEFSCCTHNISKTLHYGNLYNFDLNHCAHIKPMSPACKRHFIQDSCFYECEPNVRPWVVRVSIVEVHYHIDYWFYWLYLNTIDWVPRIFQ